MSNLRADTLKNQSGTDGPIFEGNLNFPTTSAIILPKGTTAERPVGVPTGFLRYNTEDSLVEYWDGTAWSSVNTFDPSSYRGVFGGGTPSNNTIDYITLVSLGNATDFGDLLVSRYDLAACSSSTLGVFGGGQSPNVNTIDYITIASAGNALDFGDLSLARSKLAACSSSTRGVFGGGYAVSGGSAPSPNITNIIDYITIASAGNATDFGDMSFRRQEYASCSSSTRGIFGGGYVVPTVSNIIDRITIATTGNTTDFGDLTVAKRNLAACSSSTRGVFGGGQSPTPTPTIVNTIEYITIASTGNATDFGDLNATRRNPAACSSSIRGVFGGGYSPSTLNSIDFITIATTGDATDFGDLTAARRSLAACSNNHGGLL